MCSEVPKVQLVVALNKEKAIVRAFSGNSAKSR